MIKSAVLASFIILLLSFGCGTTKEDSSINANLSRAQATFDSIYQKYSVLNTCLLRENFPSDTKYVATYLATEEQGGVPNQYSYLWPFSGTFSAVASLLHASKNNKYKDILEARVLVGLEEYFDQKREPYAYASYISSEPQSDRFYDDNVWLGIDFTDVYMMTNQKKYLERAELIWKFIESGIDDKLDGGIYWCEQKKDSKNTCSNAPGSVLAFKLFEATKDSVYFYQGKALYNWTKKYLQDTSDHLYFDNIGLDGKVSKAKYAYNSGQMMQSAALLYKLTGDISYLAEAQCIARSCYRYFFTDFNSPDVGSFKLLKKGDVWFTAVMFRGFVELFYLDNNRVYINTFDKNLDYAWKHSRDDNGLFSVDWSGKTIDAKKWLLTQAAMVEMYARMAGIKVNQVK